jgi:hypothetical protein
MLIEPESGNVSIVLIGNFNPPIFHPEWFARHGLISDKEKDASEINIIHKEITSFRMDWLSVDVQPTNFAVKTQEGPFIRLADFVVKTFRDYLSHTPINKLGINREVHFSVGNEETRNRIGKILAPHEGWGAWGKDIEGSYPNKRGGMVSLTMLQRNLNDRGKGYIRTNIRPSNLISGDAGIFMQVNDHYEVENPQNQNSEELLLILEKQFDTSLIRSEWIIDQIMALKDLK